MMVVRAEKSGLLVRHIIPNFSQKSQGFYNQERRVAVGYYTKLKSTQTSPFLASCIEEDILCPKLTSVKKNSFRSEPYRNHFLFWTWIA